MKVFVLNCGSSSIKAHLYTFNRPPQTEDLPTLQLHVKWKGAFENPTLTIQKKETQNITAATPTAALEILLSHVPLSEIHCIGHRIVHGGTRYHSATPIDASLKASIASSQALAPLHNRLELDGITLLERLCPGVPQIALFDTAFHHTIPEEAYIYPLPYSLYTQGIRRFGFHGISFHYCTERATEMLGYTPKKMVICHLGSGASLAAVLDGKSHNTTMGFTPLEGLMMDTRSGSVDPGVLLHLLQQKQYDLPALTKELYEKSGLLGIYGASSDMQEVIEKQGSDPRAKLALEIYIHRLLSEIGSMVASLGGLDVLVFTAGIGENAALIRSQVCKKLQFLNLQLDEEKNALSSKQDRDLSHAASKVKTLLIHTNEALQIARSCWQGISTKKT